MFTRKHFLFLGLLAVLLLAGFWLTHNSLDPDFGWHIRTGQLTLERGIPYQDWYTFSAPTFPWINHEWLLDVGMYLVYATLGYDILLLLFLACYVGAFAVAKKPLQAFPDIILPFVLGFFATTNYLGVRPQLLSVLCIAIVWKLLNNFLERPSKWIWLLPPLFFLWANIHAGFFAGLCILFITIGLELLKKTHLLQKIPYLGEMPLHEQPYEKITTLSWVAIASFLVTFINPYTWRVYPEIFLVSTDHFLKTHIIEWLPLIYAKSPLLIYLYGSVLLSLCIIFWKKIPLNQAFFTLFFLVMALTSQRHVLLFVIITVPLFVDLMGLTRHIIQRSPKVNARFNKGLVIFSMLIILGCVGKQAIAVQSTAGAYPDQAILFLNTLPTNTRIFNDYGWGGYLIWKLPHYQYFIDGRMPSWRQNGEFVFGDYSKVMFVEDGFEHVLQKYDIDVMLLSKSNVGVNPNDAVVRKNIEQSWAGNWFKKYPKLYSWLGVSTKKNLLAELQDDGWEIIYQDNVAIVLKKPPYYGQ